MASEVALRLDPDDSSFRADPFPVFARLRSEDPVHWSDVVGGWVLTRYADVLAILRDRRCSADRITPFFDELPAERRDQMRALGQLLRKWAVFSDPPQHGRLRSLFNTAFTSRAIDNLRADIESTVEELIAPAQARGDIELMSEFAYPLPALVICSMIGLPHAYLEKIKSWSTAIEAFLGLARKPAEAYDAALGNVTDMANHLRAVIDDHRDIPREDILSRLIEASADGERLSQDELVATCMMLVFAAHTTTTHLIGNGLLALLRQPEAMTMLRADTSPASVARAVEELLRYDGPVQVARRVAVETIELAGRRIRPGDMVFPMLNAANRDPAQFAEPDRLDLARSDNRHIAFGFGPHFCAGAPLARMEAQIALTAVVTKFRDLQIAGPIQWIDSFGFRGLKSFRLDVHVH